MTARAPNDGPEAIQWTGSAALGAPSHVVFAFISDHSALPLWIPGLTRVDVDLAGADEGGVVGVRRILHMFAGAPGTEIVTEFEPARCLVYSATDQSLRGLLTDHRAELRCEECGGWTQLSWSISGKPSRSSWKRFVVDLIFSAVVYFGMRNLRRRFPLPASVDDAGACRSQGGAATSAQWSRSSAAIGSSLPSS